MDRDDYLRSKWRELVQEAKQDVLCNFPSSHSSIVLWVEEERLRHQRVLCETTSSLEIMNAKLDTLEKMYHNLKETQ